MTPKRLEAFAFVAGKRKDRERAEAIEAGTLASRGDQKAVDKKLKQLSE